MGYDHYRYARRISPTLVEIATPGGASDDLKLRANTTHDYPWIELLGASSIVYSSAYQHLFKKSAQMIATLENATNVTTLSGGGVTGDDLTLKANTIDAAPTITLEGNGDLVLGPPAGSFVKFGTYTGGAAGTSTGYISIKDIAGTTRKLMVQA